MPNDAFSHSAAFELVDTVELDRRRGQLVWLAVVCGAGSMMIALLVGTAFSPRPSGLAFATVISFVAGGFVGLGQAPVLAWAVARKKQLLALPLIYTGTIVITCLTLQQQEAVWAFVAFALAVPLLSLLALLLPNEPLLRHDRCYSCGYDVSAGHSGVCPECGAPQATTPGGWPKGEKTP